MYPNDESYQKLFLRRYPVTLLRSSLLAILDEGCGEECQKEIIEKTVCLTLVKKYPLKYQYMLSFLKSIITELEYRKMNVCDELYEMYCYLLNASASEQKTNYRHFMLDGNVDNCITIEESNALISEGTTGLCTWQASQALVSWCTLHKDLLQNKCVLELGSGVGLAGLAITNICEPKYFIFSDCHLSVLALLKSNVRVNMERVQNMKISQEPLKPNLCDTSWCRTVKDLGENMLFHGELRNTKVGVMNMRWEDVQSLNIQHTILPDVVVAADVVYDSVSFDALCEALSHLIQGNCFGILACSIRNEETINEFLSALGKQHLRVQMVSSQDIFNLIYPADKCLKVYHVTRPTEYGSQVLMQQQQ